ncbi:MULTISPECIES: FliM/FliN family flagellar motor switch protein [unclassified Pseudomonas]|uniref:FliM/FliN family flagellar motor switch protein n=1 Tax=unclassified Pseudomonas TaxID=196821 RepID=UPI000871525D|nr:MULTISPECIES: FliM/FliN family flagellar motor switch protein [unclassified Pseudomonas]SCW45321.1 type III secretion protein Q [Pseudomonas sp. NFACC56-3]SFK22848.1 type III secretion protein Q [Pseudomonas sp. NFACC52]
MSALPLRRVEPLAHAQAQAIQRWRRAGRDTGLGQVPGHDGYLRFCAQGDGGHWQGLVAAHDWLYRALPQLQSWLKVETSLMNIVELFRVLPRPLPLEVDELQYRALSDIECVAPARLPSRELPWLETPRGRLWLLQLPPTAVASEGLGVDSWLDDLPLRLELMLGISHLSRASRMRLGEGDVVRIVQRSQRCCLADYSLGIFTFTQEGLHMQPSVTDANADNPSETATIDLGALPVRLEFLLPSHETDLATLSRIIDGQLIPLTEDAARHIEVRANGKPVARGELVQLDGQLGVELLQVYRASADE